jgi:hypothetical protein
MRIHETLGPEFLTAVILGFLFLTLFPHIPENDADAPPVLQAQAEAIQQ